MRMNAQMTFTHPGALNSKADLDFVKAKIAAGEQPWTGKFNELKNLATPFNNNSAPQDQNGATENAMKADARQCYANALAWYYTGTDGYAQNAIKVLNVWANTFNGFATNQGQSQLNCAWIGSLFGPAAEIMRGYTLWGATARAATVNMFKTKFVPALNKQPVWNNGNIDLTMAEALYSIAVFCEDAALFNAAGAKLNARAPLYFYTKATGTPPNAGEWFAPSTWLDGLMQETCRTGGGHTPAGNDNGHHAQFALAAAIHAAEIAWNQGVDQYAAHQAQFVAALELLSLQLSSGTMQKACNDNTATQDLYNTFEMGYNHYHNRKGINLPNTLQLLTARVRVNATSDWNIFYETLTHNSGATAGPVNKAPTVNITAPLNNSVFNAPASIAIASIASDADGTISKVEFYNGAALLGTVVAAPYTYNWTGVAAGTYNITAKAYDNSNASTVSAAVAISVKGVVVGNQAPSVSISNPLNNASYTAPATFSIAANASDVDGTISKVEFYNGAALLGTALAAPYSYNWTGLAAGTYSITAKAYDNLNAATISGPINIAVGTVATGACTTLNLTSAGWILRNNWSDQNNGSVLSNDAAGSLKASHRQWGANYFWLISSSKYALTAGTKYTVSYDVMGSQTIVSTEVGITTAIPNSDPALAQASVVALAGYTLNTYGSKSIVITPTASGSYCIAIKINLSAQPPVVATFNIKNLKYCPPAGTFKTDEQADISSSSVTVGDAGLKVYPNPAQNQLVLEYEGFSKYEIYNIQGKLVLEGTIVNKQQVDISSVDSGMYLVIVSNTDGRAAQRVVKE